MTASDSATTERTPPGLASRARVTSKWPSKGNSSFIRSGTLTLTRPLASLHSGFRFCQNQQFATHSIEREKQLLIDFLCESAGGPIYYRGREILLAHRGMNISESDWNVFLGHAAATLAKFKVLESEQRDVVAFVQSLKNDIVK